MAPKPEALPSVLPSELLTFILAHQTYPTTLVICQSRKEFMDSLLCDVSAATHNDPTPKSCHHNNSSTRAQNKLASIRALLAPTLYQLASSRFTNIVFMPTVSHLRAYLAVFPQMIKQTAMPDNWLTGISGGIPLLILYGLIDLHHDTNEWSAQGLGNTLAGLVEAGKISSRKVILLEKWGGDAFDDDRIETNMDINDINRCNIWNIRVPILSMNVKNAGIKCEDICFSGRTTEIGRILARWFIFSAHKLEHQVH